MRKLRIRKISSLVFVLVALVAGCGREQVPSPVFPTVIATFPANGANDVATNTTVSADFGSVMNPSTINTTTFTLTGPGATPVAGGVSYAGTTAIFTPTVTLAANTRYVATVTTGAQDPGGIALAANFVWNFTTAPPPTVISTIPANGATAVAVNTAISATFSEAMNPATINAATFTLTGPGATPVAGTVTYAGTSATFTPTAVLATGTLYMATITTGAKDPTGAALAANFVWTFTTAAPPTVISTVPVNGATAASINTTISATFSRAMNPVTINATTFTLTGPGATPVAGTVTYAGTTATFTPIAVLATGNLYTATITTGAKDPTGAALAANFVWTFTAAVPPTVVSTVPANGAMAVAVNTAIISATFSEAMDPATITAATFTLTGPGATPVAGTVAYAGTTATFTPTAVLATGTLYMATITTGAKNPAGTGLAASFVWTFTTAPPPTVISTVPVNGATAVAVNTAIFATFRGAMNPATINATTFTVTGPGATPVAGTVTYSGNTAAFTPTAVLPNSTVFTATITTGAQNLVGQALLANFVWNFTTAAPPTVVSTIPVNGATAVAVNTTISATFSEAMNPATIDAATFTLTGPGATPVAGTVTYAGTIATFTPTAVLTTSTSYTATITTGARGSAGAPLAANVVWRFTTAPPATVVSTIPANGAATVAVNTVVSATFSEAMNSATINAATFTLTGPGATPVAGTVTYAGTTATFTPTAVLSTSTLYTATITTGARDPAGTALAANFVWTFTTAAPASVVSTVPANGTVAVPVNTVVSATFSEAMNPATINAATFTLTGPGFTLAAGAVTYTGTTATFTPTTALAAGTLYTATITTGARDPSGVGLAANYVWTFATAPSPLVVATVPVNGATAVAVNTPISATFSQAMNPATISAATFTLTGPGATPVSGIVTYAGTTATFTPTAVLTTSTLYTATITTGAKNPAGVALAANYVWTFTTASPATVVSTIPANGAATVAVNTAISATFSEAMNPATINTATFTLTGPGATSVGGTVTYSGSTATFTPTAVLAAGIPFTATITTGAKNPAGVALAANYVWTFTTAAPPTVVSTSPVNAATAVAVNTAVSATFSEAMNPATITAATFTLTGPVATPVAGTVSYAGTTARFTPTAVLTTSTLYMATITTGAKDPTGAALAANFVWTFTTAAPPTVVSTIPVNGATAAALNMAVSATFSEPMNPATINGTTFTLAGPGVTPVGGIVTYSGAAATFTPSTLLASGILYTATITTGAKDPTGAGLAANFVWTFTTAVPPTVVSTSPVNAATAVAVNTAVSATFSEVMDPATITAATFTLTGSGATPVSGTVTYAGTTATFTPTAVLTTSTSYMATITTGAKDPTGAALAANFVWTFTTAPPPTVISTVPGNGASAVAANAAISATFSEAMDPATITATTFTLAGPGATSIGGTVSYSGSTATFTPSVDLATGILFTATIRTGAKDPAGVGLAANYVWTFTTASPPKITFTTPAGRRTNVPVNQKIAATFNTPMNASTITATGTFTLEVTSGGAAVLGAVTYDAASNTAILAPTGALAASTQYTATVTTAAQSAPGTALAANYIWSFTTGIDANAGAPRVTSTNPASAALNVPVNQKIAATFSQAMDPATISAAGTFTVAETISGTAAPGGIVYDAASNTAIFTPASALLGNTEFTAVITPGAADLISVAMGANFVWSFTTGSTADALAPTITATNPTSAVSNVPLNMNINATFSKAMDPVTITTATFSLAVTGVGGVPVDGTVAYDPTSQIATFRPVANLTAGTQYTATISNLVTDLFGNALATGVASNPWTFTTGSTLGPRLPDLGAASTFGGFGGGAGITNSGSSTVINGDLGTTGASTLITGFHDAGTGCDYTITGANSGFVNGKIYTNVPPPTGTCPSEGTAVTFAIATQAASDALIAYNNLAGEPGGPDPGAGQLGGLTITPGTYTSASGSFMITGSDLTLDAQGDANAIWVFQMASTLIVGAPGFPRSVILINGAQPKNIFWEVGSAATINGAGGGTMVGTIIAAAGITFSTAGNAAITTLDGRAIGLNASVTMVNTVINVPSP